MATPSHRSPSPISSRTTTFRSTENRDPLRKSCNSNFASRPSFAKNSRSFNPPPTPVNSPMDFPQRIVGFREGSVMTRVSNDQKENENESNLNSSKGIRARSPVTVKGVKSFMAPTISAASKVVPSPKTKVLAERNEDIGSSQVRLDLSAPVSEEKTPFSSMNPLELAEEEAKEEIGTNPDVSFDAELPNDTNNLLPNDSEKNSVNGVASPILDPLEPDPSLPPTLDPLEPDPSLPPTLDPLEPDPSLPPYDPKTNYLSPRPQFLRYKPNPRIELYLNKEKVLDIGGEGKNLEESFTSESSSNTEPIVSEDDLSSEEKVEDSISEDLDRHVSEGESENSHGDEVIVKTTLQSHSFLRLKRMHLVLLLLFGYISALTLTDSPFESSFFEYRDLSLAKLHDPALEVFSGLEHYYRNLKEGKRPVLREPLMKIVDSANRNIEGFTHNLLPYLSKLFSISREEKMGSFISSFLLNSTTSDRDYNEQVQLDNVNRSVAVENKESYENEEELIEIKAEEVIQNEEKDEDSVVEETVIEEGTNLDMKTEENEEKAVEDFNILELDLNCKIEAAVIEEGINLDIKTEENEGKAVEDCNILELDLNCNIEAAATEEQNNLELKERENVESPGIEHDPEINDSDMSLPESSSVTNQKPEFDTDYKDSQVLATTDSIIHEIGDKFFMQNVIGISSILLTLLGIVASLYFKKNRTSVRNVTTTNPPLSSPKKMINDSMSASGESYSCFQNLASKFAEEEMVGESHPAEMSSTSEKSFSCDWRLKLGKEEKIQSHEKRVKRNSNRDSTISSDYSVGSPSYGSFTTLELLSSKQGCGDGEKVTPVRRSSRIRKQVLSP